LETDKTKIMACSCYPSVQDKRYGKGCGCIILCILRIINSWVAHIECTVCQKVRGNDERKTSA